MLLWASSLIKELDKKGQPCNACACKAGHATRANSIPMVLPDYQIRALCAGEHQPLAEPFDESLLNPASYDIRLNDDLLIETVISPDMIPYPFHRHDEKNPYLLQPHQFVLASSLEIFHFPDNIAGQFLLKSSRARSGLEHLHAGWIDPGFNRSRLTLELVNLRQLHPIPIWPGLRIGQICLQEMAARPLKSYRETGRYNGDAAAQGSKG